MSPKRKILTGLIRKPPVKCQKCGHTHFVDEGQVYRCAKCNQVHS